MIVGSTIMIMTEGDKALFKQPPPNYEDCPICFLRLPTYHGGWQYRTCCGKVVCSGCIHACDKNDHLKCPFCRTLAPKSDEETIKIMTKRMEVGDALAIYSHGCDYYAGTCGVAQDYAKAFELHLSASDLGYAAAHHSVGFSYHTGRGVEVDKKKAMYYWNLAAREGDTSSRHNLGNTEVQAGNVNRALKHFMIAVRDGNAKSLEETKRLYTNGYATKDKYTKALRLYQSYLSEIKSIQRDEAAAYDDKNRYY